MSKRDLHVGPVEAMFEREAARLAALAAYVMDQIYDDDFQKIHAAAQVMHFLAAKACCEPEFEAHVLSWVDRCPGEIELG